MWAPALLYGCTLLFAIGPAAAASREPHIALLLPLASPSFARPADAVRQGFTAAAKAAGKDAPLIRVYPVNEDTLNVLTIYEQALESGAQMVVGPLTRSGVAALAASSLVTVPTLALNTLESRTPPPARLYLFGIGVEQEARQIAQLALSEGRRNAFVLADDSALGKRMRQAFVGEFARRGGITVAELTYGADQGSLVKLRETVDLRVADMMFLALDAARARIVRPYLGTSLALYATSQVNAGGAANNDLNGVRFVDMPWLLLPDHPAVMVYPRATGSDSIELERLYALGIDAFRLGLELMKGARDPSLDGVTGQVKLRDQQFVRELPVAQFVAGKPVVQEGRR